MAFGYYSAYNVQSAQVPSTQTDFPVLVSVTDARFKTVGNGGHVQNSSGFDIRPYTDTTLSTAITGFQLEKYVASTGEIIMWVKASSLSSSTTPFVLAYGDSGISTDGSSSTTWSNNFLQVYHFRDGTTLSLVDSVGGSNATNGGATATTGKINGAAAFVTVNLTKITTGSVVNPSAITYSAWINGTTFPAAYNTIIEKGTASGSVNNLGLDVKSNGKLNVEVRATTARQYDGTGSHTLSTGTTYLIHVTYDSSAGLIGYVNGASDGTVAANGALASSTAVTEIGHNSGFNCCFWNGFIDEVRFCSVARSSDWISTEYNNQSAPGTFATLGTEVPVSATNTANFMAFM